MSVHSRLQRADAAVARALASASSLDEAIDALLRTIGQQLGWDAGAYWRLDAEVQRLTLTKSWTARGRTLDTFWDDSNNYRFPRGVGLPGEAWASGVVVWMPTLPDAERFPRHRAAIEAGLHSGIAFPLLGDDGETLGVMEFFTSRERSIRDEGVHLTETIAWELPQFIRRLAAADRIQRSEARLSAMQAAALDAIIWMEASGVVSGWNPAAERTFGYTADEAIGRTLAELIVPPRVRSAHWTGLSRYLATREATLLDRRVEVMAIDKSGREFPVELIITCVSTRGELHFVGYLRDISERLALETERRQLLAEAQQATQTRDQLLAVVSHDLRNSLNAVVVSASTLQLVLTRVKVNDPFVPRSVETILRAASQMRQLIADLLDAATIQTGRLSVNLEDHDFSALIREAVELHQALAQEKGVLLTCDLTTDNTTVSLDRGRMMQVVSNLLGNAIKFCRPGDAIKVRLFPEADQICVAVEDNGPGIAAEALQHIFKPHWSGDLPGKGTGLGLFISRRLIEAHRGTLTAKSLAEGGATFTICLPQRTP